MCQTNVSKVLVQIEISGTPEISIVQQQSEYIKRDLLWKKHGQYPAQGPFNTYTFLMSRVRKTWTQA